ncbi:hypothetical protein [Nostoc sp. NMS4]|nr:hypothetical protein [Nostoc sp. NMS4]
MGILDAIQGTRVYLDTNIWIYANDRRFRNIPELSVILLSEINSP